MRKGAEGVQGWKEMRDTVARQVGTQLGTLVREYGKIFSRCWHEHCGAILVFVNSGMRAAKKELGYDVTQELERSQKVILSELQAIQRTISRAQDATKVIELSAQTVIENAETEAKQCLIDLKEQAKAADREAKECINSAKNEAIKILHAARMESEDVKFEVAKWEEEKERIASTHNLEPTIKLDIGGHSFTTTLTTLTRFPESMIGAMFSGRHALTKNDAGAHFIDRDGTHFREILNYLRNPESWVNSGFQGRQSTELKSEAEYYGLKDRMFPITTFVPAVPEVVDNCCVSTGRNHRQWNDRHGTITVTQHEDQLWYMQNESIGSKVVKVCENCGLGWPTGCGHLHRVANFKQGRTISPDQPKRVATCPACKQA